MTRVWYEPNEFPALTKMRDHWVDILREYQYAQVDRRLKPWNDHALAGGRWEVYGLHDLPGNKPIYPNVDMLPFTTSLIEELIPGHGTAAFSVLGPKSRIFPHVAHPSPFIRAHLGLIVPEGDCRMWVVGESRPWEEGEWLVFNEHLNHSAWNRTAFARTILIVDIPDV